VGGRITIPDPVTSAWLHNARAKVLPAIEKRRASQAARQAEASRALAASAASAASASRRPLRPAEPQAVLVYREGSEDEQVYPLTGEGLSIGRGRDNHIQIKNDSKVSRFHARVFARHESFYVADNNSSNGTLVDGCLITEHRLSGGEELVIGETLFRFRTC